MSDEEFNREEEFANQNSEDRQLEEYEKKQYFKELVERVKQVQTTIKQVKSEIEEEKILREEASRQLETKRDQIRRLLMKQNQTTTDKVEGLIRDTLENLVHQTLQKQQELKDLKENERERCFLNYELERQFRGLRGYIQTTKKEIQESDEHAQKLKIQIQRQTNTNLLLRTDVDEKTQKIQQLRLEAQQLRATIQNLNDVKKVINRVQDQDQIIIDNQVKKPTRNSSQRSSQIQKANYNTHDVDDNFWYRDNQLKLPSVQSTRKKQY